MHPMRLKAAATSIALVLVTGCTTTYRMGDPIKASQSSGAPPTGSAQAPAPQAPLTVQAAPASRASVAAPARPAKLDKKRQEWELKWQQIQSSHDTVDWINHFQVCGIKYRYRDYDQLFRCLDLFEAKVAAGGRTVAHLDEARAVAPVLAGWLRATAYAELGQPDVALKWADSAWSQLPQHYREPRFTMGEAFHALSETQARREAKVFSRGMIRVGGDSIRSESGNWGEDREKLFGRDNPAGLDLNAEAIAMGLDAQRALFSQELGLSDRANAALADLNRWHLDCTAAAILTFGVSADCEPPAMKRGHLLALGPLFAMGRYAEVVKLYETYIGAQNRHRHVKEALDSAYFVLFLPWALPGYGMQKATEALYSSSDIRLFTLATEDAANALIYAQSLVRLGRMDEARAMLDTLLAMPEIRALGNLYWVTLYERGLVALKAGKQAEGIGFLSQSIDAIEAVRSTISLEGAKIGFAGDKQAVYGALVAAFAARGDWNGAFLTAERAKARALVDLLAQRRDLPAPVVADDRVRELFANAQTLEANVGLPSDEDAVRGIKITADSRTALVSVAPEAASLVSVQQVTAEDVTKRISHGETLIDYFAVGDTLYAFVLDGRPVQGFRLSAKGLDEDVRAFRESIERRNPDARARGRSLYDRLMRPLAGTIQGDALTIAPHGALHYLPFDALVDGDHYLIDRFSIRLIPSAATLGYLRSDRPTKTGRVLALGNPDLGDSRYDLPNAQIEAVNVAALFPDSRALVRSAASKSAVKELGNGFSILHFATHGKFDADAPLSSGLYLAKGSAPDGILTVSDLYLMRWDVDLVTLSACETGLGKVANGDDVIGLTRGFLYAGARSIVASLWEVDDAATEHLMVSFYRNLEGHGKREALRLAQLETRQRYPDPRYWAAFQVVGRAD
jgi:CHAT domain-containing protein